LFAHQFAQHVREKRVEQAMHDDFPTQFASVHFLFQHAHRQRQRPQAGQAFGSQNEPRRYLAEEGVHGFIPELIGATDD